MNTPSLEELELRDHYGYTDIAGVIATLAPSLSTPILPSLRVLRISDTISPPEYRLPHDAEYDGIPASPPRAGRPAGDGLYELVEALCQRSADIGSEFLPLERLYVNREAVWKDPVWFETRVKHVIILEDDEVWGWDQDLEFTGMWP